MLILLYKITDVHNKLQQNISIKFGSSTEFVGKKTICTTDPF